MVDVVGFEPLVSLGRDRFGTVLRSVDGRRDCTVALRLLPRRQLRDGAAPALMALPQVTARLRDDHPVALVFDAGLLDDVAYVASEYFARGSLLDRPLAVGDPASALSLLWPIASGLHAAHGWDVVHGALDESHIVYGRDDQLLLTDLGVAAAVEPPPPLHWRGTGTAPPDVADDVAALARVLLHVLERCEPRAPAVEDVLQRALAVPGARSGMGSGTEPGIEPPSVSGLLTKVRSVMS